MGSRIIALSYNFSLDYTLNYQQRRFGTVAVSVEAVPKVPTPRVHKSAVCDPPFLEEYNMSYMVELPLKEQRWTEEQDYE